MFPRRIFVIAPALSAVCLVIGAWAASDQQQPKPSKKTLVQSIQPNYAKWRSVTTGMTEAEVEKLLGKPLEKNELSAELQKLFSNPIAIDETQETEENAPIFVKSLTYGRINFDSPSMPATFDFDIEFHQGKVIGKHHPFGGVLSTNGKPTTPVLISPQDKSVFNHYPRFVDCRWNPSSGDYPIQYTVEVQFAQDLAQLENHTVKRTYVQNGVISSDCPYGVFTFVGAQSGRWRVKAKNAAGESKWTNWRYFRFTQ